MRVVPAVERGVEVGAVAGHAGGRRRPVVDAGQVERRRPPADRDPLVAQHVDAQGGQVPQPGPGVDEVLVVAGDEEDALLADQVGQRGDVLAQLVDAAVDQVADDRHDVRPLGVDDLDQPLEPPSAVGGRQVGVGEGDDPQPVERRVQAAAG